MKQALFSVLTLTVILAPAALASQEGADDALRAAKSMTNSLVQVEFTLQYDKGQPPTSTGWGDRCPGCGRFHVQAGETFVEQERPLDRPGYLISPTRVLTHDLLLQPRFVQSIEVRFGDQVTSARIAAHCVDQYAMILELDEPLAGASPLTLDPFAEGPYFLASWHSTNGEWLLHAAALPTTVVTSAIGRSFVPLRQRGVIINGDGVAVGAAMNEELPPDESWKGSPEDWDWINADELSALKDAAEMWAGESILRVKLDLRSPQTAAAAANPWMGRRGGDDEDATERDALALLVDSDTILILESMRPSTTARLERITVFPDGREPIDATFAHSLLDYGAFVATLNEPLSAPAHLWDGDILDLRNRVLLAADVSLQGEHRIAYYGHTRIPRYEVGWRRNIYPDIPGSVDSVFLFNTMGDLVALPLYRRPKAGEERRWRHGGENLTPVAQLAAVLADLPAHADESNVPLGEDDENRLAWLGVELQELDEELARMYEVSELSSDGTHGGLITFVHPRSPAAEAGLETGMILLRVHSPRHPRPLPVQGDPYATFAGSFPWHRLDEVPEEYFEHIPQPWPSANNPFNRLLTELGFGTPFKAEVFHNGEVRMYDFTVVEGPRHFDAATRLRSDSLGMTVRNLTYEVRRHFQKSEDDPGVIVSRIEPGSRVSVGGLKPYEIITHVNDKPIAHVKAFEEAIEGQTEVRLGVQRMTRHRIVKITLDAPAAAAVTDVAIDGEDRFED